MIGKLPTSLKIKGRDYSINSDYRVALLILQAFNDDNLSDEEKIIVCIRCLYKNYQLIELVDYEEALNQAVWFLNIGDTVQKPHTNKPVYDWEQDEQMLFSSINKVAGQEVRSIEYLHFWSFMGYFNEIGEGMFSTVVSIRQKRNKGQKLEKWEQEFYRNNKEVVDLKRKYTKEEKADLDALDKILKGE